jgi:hypothetical protein
MTELQAVELLQIVALCSAAALVSEIVLWLWAFRNDSFRLLRVRYSTIPRYTHQYVEKEIQAHSC